MGIRLSRKSKSKKRRPRTIYAHPLQYTKTIANRIPHINAALRTTQSHSGSFENQYYGNQRKTWKKNGNRASKFTKIDQKIENLPRTSPNCFDEGKVAIFSGNIVRYNVNRNLRGTHAVRRNGNDTSNLRPFSRHLHSRKHNFRKTAPKNVKKGPKSTKKIQVAF